MLVLGRKVGQFLTLKVGEEVIEVVLAKASGGSAQIGIQASPNVTIMRGELEEPPKRSKVA